MAYVSKKDVILEVMSMCGVKWQVAKSIVELAALAPGEVRKIGPHRAGARKPMWQQEAAMLVAEAKRRIAIADGEQPDAEPAVHATNGYGGNDP